MRNSAIAVLALFISACQIQPDAPVAAKPPPSAPAAPIRDAQDIDQSFVSMLKAKQFRELDDAFVAVQRAYQNDPLTENQMDVACRAFYRPGGGFQPLLDEWVNEMPRSYSARLARGAIVMLYLLAIFSMLAPFLERA